ncbi:hypothetical protein FISHEDRAFT_45811 [Fistulina hepatica ATCC 64428]|uniref:AB hydrolase-1 domain-containing protein n=1 Tax=Fistulina hepatica ATCC 64428 TaxID=1128425 RepID=A0A0D7A8W4_9AGAR|nr:hypothetical protein FISHEDRAFT_45811 [Fistulina hepatica ATCC 64428]
MDVDPIILPPSAEYPLYITAKRYTPRPPPNGGTPRASLSDKPAATLIFLHSTSFMKEIWEPCIADIFANQRLRRPIATIFAIDCPNHGAAGMLNASSFHTRKHLVDFSCEKYALAVRHFLMRAPEISREYLIGVGHSLGAIALVILQSLNPAAIHFQRLVLVEPLLIATGTQSIARLRARLLKGAYARRQTWPDRSSAQRDLASRGHKWDPRSMHLYLKHGLYEELSGVALCCSREQEIAMYNDEDGATAPLFDLTRACETTVVHIVFGKPNSVL